MKYYAHSAPSKKEQDFEPLADHLRQVAELAACFAAKFGAEEEARLAGLLHDLGKYGDPFERRLRGQGAGLDHWSAGALAALLSKPTSWATVFAILGHHLGLPNQDHVRGLPREREFGVNARGGTWTETSLDLLRERFHADGFTLPSLPRFLADFNTGGRAAAMVDVRLLFSTLVDADYLETERWFARFDPTKGRRPEALALDAERACSRLKDHLATLAAANVSAPSVRALRGDLLAACLAAAQGERGLYTMTAPTGSGKTLAMLAFALEHARVHGLDRVILAIPYLAILEQTVGIYRSLLEPKFGAGYVLEHHSLADLNRQRSTDASRVEEEDSEDGASAEGQRRLLAENWDAPLVLTTNVQLLESLFANRPGACRKLHRLANSVILFDEAQSLPKDLAVPTLAALSRLAERYGATVVFATATQPAFDHLHPHVQKLASNGWQPREIAPPSLQLFERARRTRVVWDHESPKSLDEVADQIAKREQVLAIVNLKRHALALTEAVAARCGHDEVFHLSTNLCPDHRRKVLALVRERLDRGAPCRLVSTQCIEAGVDVDFPLVLRAFAPLDAIAQAAGRCNRNGKLPDLGEVRVFQWDEESVGRGLFPSTTYANGAEILKGLLKSNGGTLDLDDPETYRRYYRELYVATRTGAVETEIEKNIRALDFPEVARLYNLIEKNAVEVLVPYDPEEFERLREEAKTRGHLNRDWIRSARRIAVSVYRPEEKTWIEPLAPPRDGRPPDWYALLDPDLYDRKLLGLREGSESWIA